MPVELDPGLYFCSKHHAGLGAWLPSSYFYASRPGRKCCITCYLQSTRLYRMTEAGRAAKARENHKRRACSAGPGRLTAQEWAYILEAQGYACASCSRPFSERLQPTRDHILPLSKGGELALYNTQALCRSCNSHKHTRFIDYRPTVLRQAVMRLYG